MENFNLPKGYSPVSIPRYNPQQNKILQNLLGKLGMYGGQSVDTLGQMAAGSNEYFTGRENQAMDFFNNRLLPQIKQQYANQGMLGSSAFGGTMAQAGADLSSGLYNQRQDLQRQAIQDLLGLTQSLSTTPTQEYGFLAKPEKKKFDWGSLLGLLGTGIKTAMAFI